MKKMILCLLFPLFLVAKSGNAVIPHFLASDGSDTSVYISNVSDEDVEVKVSFYHYDGTLLLDDNKVNTGSITAWPTTVRNYHESASGHSVAFTVGADETITISISGAPYKGGYGEIEWTQNSKKRKVLVAHGRVQVHSKNLGYSLHINNGAPF